MQKYVCDACGYVYDPAENDNVKFEDLPEDWVCPVCGVGKDLFSPIDQNALGVLSKMTASNLFNQKGIICLWKILM